MYETGAPPAPPPLPDEPTAAVVVDLPGPPPALRIDHAANVLLPPVRPEQRPTAVPQYDSVVSVVPGPPPGATTYRLRGTETSQDG